MRTAAIVTGATGGIGREFVRQLASKDLDTIVAVGRNEDKLESLKQEFGAKILAVKADLSTDEGLEHVKEAVKDLDIRYLVNNAGAAYMGRFEDMSVTQAAGIVDINCRACVLLVSMVLPQMRQGAVIINISSASAFQPNPYLTLYSASKVFLRSFSRALNVELKERGILSVAVCPGWVDTDMLKKDGKTIKLPGMVTPEKVVTKALKDASKGKDMSMSSLYNKYLHVYSKLMPQKTVMRQWAGVVRRYLND